MDSKILENLKQIRKHSAIKKAFSSYSYSIAEVLITNPHIIERVCEEFGITNEELLFIITREDVSNLSFLDEIMDYASKINTNEKESIKVYGKNNYSPKDFPIN